MTHGYPLGCGQGELLLIDEISLAEDAVLERLNSVLDPARIIVLPEKGRDIEEVVAASSFRLLATMNPGGDFGKKELSPALRNRFTEIWVPAVGARAELLQLLHARLPIIDASWDAPNAMLNFCEWLQTPGSGASGGAPAAAAPSLRDLTAWVDFQLASRTDVGPFSAFVHGACLVFVDGMGLQVASTRGTRGARRHSALQKLLALLPLEVTAAGLAALHVSSDTVPETLKVPEGCTDLLPGACTRAERKRDSHDVDAVESAAVEPESWKLAPTSSGCGWFGIPPFFVSRGCHPPTRHLFSLEAPTTRANAFRVFRAMQVHAPPATHALARPHRQSDARRQLPCIQLRKPILLEGSPGVGKTTLIQALGAACGHTVVRINLSEQSDLMELLGADLPVEGATAGTYAFCLSSPTPSSECKPCVCFAGTPGRMAPSYRRYAVGIGSSLTSLI